MGFHRIYRRSSIIKTLLYACNSNRENIKNVIFLKILPKTFFGKNNSKTKKLRKISSSFYCSTNEIFKFERNMYH